MSICTNKPINDLFGRLSCLGQATGGCRCPGVVKTGRGRVDPGRRPRAALCPGGALGSARTSTHGPGECLTRVLPRPPHRHGDRMAAARKTGPAQAASRLWLAPAHPVPSRELADHLERCDPAWVGPAFTLPGRGGPLPASAFRPPGAGVRRRWHGGLGEAGLCAADFVAQVHGVLAPDDDGRGTAAQGGVQQAGYACPAASAGVLAGNIIKRWSCGAAGPGGLPGRCGVATCHGCPPGG